VHGIPAGVHFKKSPPKSITIINSWKKGRCIKDLKDFFKDIFQRLLFWFHLLHFISCMHLFYRTPF
jgi:hypothetical protein